MLYRRYVFEHHYVGCDGYDLSCYVEHRRDIKPENIFFDDSNNLRLGDFGLAINETRERPTARVGTLDYMSPEVRYLSLPQHAPLCKTDRRPFLHAKSSDSLFGLLFTAWEMGEHSVVTSAAPAGVIEPTAPPAARRVNR